MMQATIARKQSAQRSFAVSTGLHALLFVMILAFAGRGGVEGLRQTEELTNIAYIEARYGEDVAAKVRMKSRKPLNDAPPGPGIETRSAMKPKTPTPRPALSTEQKLASDVSAPKLERKDPTFAQLEREKLRSRTQASPANPGLSPESVRRDPSLAEVGGTPRLSSRVGGTPDLPDAGRALVSRGQARLDEGGPDVPGRTTGTGSKIADPGVSAPALQSRGVDGGGRTWDAPTASLGDRGGSKADLDVGGTPVPGGGSAGTTGRRTVLDYGSGGGGGGSGLSGRAGTLREAPPAPTPGAPDTADQGITEAAPVKVKGEGSNMTISGQIAGRKILYSVAPEYSKSARKNGWEGVVAVHFTVLADGRVKDNVFFEQTSAHRDLNQAAMAAIKQFRFAALPSGQTAVEQWGIITIVFRLN